MIPAYSPQARGRSERSFGTWQGRLPQELRLHGITTLEAANKFLREHYIGEFNSRFQVAALQRGNAFLPCPRKNLDLIFSLQFERTVNRDNTVSFQNLHRLSRCSGEERWRAAMSKCISTWTGPSASPTGRIDWDAIAPKVWPSTQTKTRRRTLWKRRRLDELQQPDISLATKSGHFNLLLTEENPKASQRRNCCNAFIPPNDCPTTGTEPHLIAVLRASNRRAGSRDSVFPSLLRPEPQPPT
jgi:hypothetical protein